MAAKVMDQLAKFIAQDQESFSNMRIYVKGDLRKKKCLYNRYKSWNPKGRVKISVWKKDNISVPTFLMYSLCLKIIKQVHEMVFQV